MFYLQVAIIWRIIKTMYGEEFYQSNINPMNTSREDSIGIVSSMICVDHSIDNDQRSKGARNNFK